MKLIIGLGNPGKKYETTWHNLGFLAVDALAASKPEMFLKCKQSAKFKAEVCEGSELEEKIILAKPRTFMNKSGQAVKAIMSFYKIKPLDLWVIHDDIDLPLGKIRIRKGGSAGGHHGMESIISSIGTNDFMRIRVGIGRPIHGDITGYVLGRFTNEEKEPISQAISTATKALESAVKTGIDSAMNHFSS